MANISLNGATLGQNDAQGLGIISWTCECHLRAAAFHSPLTGEHETTQGGFSPYARSEALGLGHWSVDLRTLAPCGTYQFDMERWAGDQESGDLTVNFGVSCGTVQRFDPPTNAPVPEPTTMALLSLGLVLAGLRRRTR